MKVIIKGLVIISLRISKTLNSQLEKCLFDIVCLNIDGFIMNNLII